MENKINEKQTIKLIIYASKEKKELSEYYFVTDEEKESEKYFEIDEKKSEELISFIDKLEKNNISKDVKLEYGNNYKKIIKGKSFLFILENKDLILDDKKYIFIYRLKINEYYLFKKIEKLPKCPQKSHTVLNGCIAHEEPLKYVYLSTKKLKENKFIMISSYQMDLYSLNDKNEYLCEIKDYSQESGLRSIYEISDYIFVFVNEVDYEYSMIGPGYHCFQLYYLFWGKYRDFIEIIDEYKADKLKNNGGYACLKEYYFLILLDNFLIISNYNKGLIEYYIPDSIKLIKMESKEDDEFIICYESGAKLLFKIFEKEDGLDFDLKIIGCNNNAKKNEFGFKFYKIKEKKSRSKRRRKW